MGTTDGGLRLDLLQPAGKRLQEGGAWLNGRRGQIAYVAR
jgi:hypothetical protein